MEKNLSNDSKNLRKDEIIETCFIERILKIKQSWVESRARKQDKAQNQSVGVGL